MTFFAELKRRNVVRVGIAYAVGAWLLLQMTEVLSELLKLPEQIGPIVVSIVAIGLPIALFFAWAYEMTPEGLKKEHEVDRSVSITNKTGRKLDRAIILMLVLIAGYFIWESRFAERDQSTSEEIVAETAPADEQASDSASENKPVINPKSIAVLPFDNRSRLEEDEFFVEGIHDDLLTNLARIGSLKVISRTSMLRFKDTEKPIPEIATELGVATVMEGAVQRSGNTVRINVQLIDAITDEHLWAEIFDRELTADNLFAIQSEISEKIAAALKATLSPEEHQRINERPTQNLAAYNAYLRGRQHMSRRNSTDLYRALEEFERAVELDPDFALAWVGVAETTGLLPGYSSANVLEMVERQEFATERALELNDQLGEAYLSLAEVHQFHERNEEAETAYLKAIELSPNYATAYFWYSTFMNQWPKRYMESLALIRKASELDPLSSIIQANVAEKYIILGRYDEAEAHIRRLLTQDPDFAPAFGVMSSLMANTGQFDQQVFWLRKATDLDPDRIGVYQGEAVAMMNLGDEQGVARVRRTMADINDQHWSIGWVDLVQNISRKNYPAALENMNWINQELGTPRGLQISFGFIYLIAGKYEDAREAFELGEPRLLVKETWGAAIGDLNGVGCIYSWLLARTGDPETGRDLLNTTLAYMENDLPTYLGHADRFEYPDCYAINGDLEKAMEAFETQVDHGHIDFWWVNTEFPWFEPLRGTPRWQAALQQIHDNNAIQRENLEQMEAEAGP